MRWSPTMATTTLPSVFKRSLATRPGNAQSQPMVEFALGEQLHRRRQHGHRYWLAALANTTGSNNIGFGQGSRRQRHHGWGGHRHRRERHGCERDNSCLIGNIYGAIIDPGTATAVVSRFHWTSWALSPRRGASSTTLNRWTTPAKPSWRSSR